VYDQVMIGTQKEYESNVLWLWWL